MELGSIVSVNLTPPPSRSIELPWSALTKDISEPAVWLVDGD
jgi:membrane fusion protein, multidrug efflux system